MYHTLPTECQTQFLGGQAIEVSRSGWGPEFRLAPVRPVACLKKNPNRLASGQPALHLFEAADRKPRFSGEGDQSNHTLGKLPLDLIHEVIWHLNLLPCGPSEVAFAGGCGKDRPLRTDPHTAPRKLFQNVRDDLAFGTDHETDQSTLWLHFAGDDAPPIRGFPILISSTARHSAPRPRDQTSASSAVSSSSTGSSDTRSAGSTQPSMTRADITIS